mgnify:CR=1 FL=1
MKIHYTQLFLTLLAFMPILSACQSGSDLENTLNPTQGFDEFKSYSINIDQGKVRFSDFFEEVSFIRMEETSESLLGNILQLSSTGQEYVFTGSKKQEVFVYSVQGKFSNKFNHVGEGEGQYGAINDLWLSGDTVVIYDSKKRTVLWYAKNGDFFRSEKMPVGTGHVLPLGTGFLTDMTFAPKTDSTNYLVQVLNSELEVRNTLIPNVKGIAFPMGQNANSFRWYDGKLIFKPVYEDTTYFIDEARATPFIQIDFGEKYLWKDEALTKDLVAAFTAIPKGEGVWNYTPFIGSDLIYMNYSLSLKELAALIDRKTGQYVIFNTFTKNEERYDLFPLVVDGERFLFSLPQSSALTLMEEMQSEQWSFSEGTLLEEIESSENPVLMWVKFKSPTI